MVYAKISIPEQYYWASRSCPAHGYNLTNFDGREVNEIEFLFKECNITINGLFWIKSRYKTVLLPWDFSITCSLIFDFFSSLILTLVIEMCTCQVPCKRILIKKTLDHSHLELFKRFLLFLWSTHIATCKN